MDQEVKNLINGMADAARMELAFRERIQQTIAMAMSIFWKDCFPIISRIVYEQVPRAMRWEELLAANPWMRTLTAGEIEEAALTVKKEHPTLSYEENLQKVLEALRPKEGGDNG